VGEGRFILDHGAKPGIATGRWRPWADQIAEVATHPGVYCKISGLVTEADHVRWRASDIEPYLAHLAKCFGPDRLIWGSDWPVCLLAATYRQTFNLVLDFVRRCCPEAEAAIFGDAAMSAYGLEPKP
jgi:L-fuconolactonase